MYSGHTIFNTVFGMMYIVEKLLQQEGTGRCERLYMHIYAFKNFRGAFIVIYPVSIIFLVCHIFPRSGYIMWKIGFKRNCDHWKCSHLINDQTTSSQLYLIIKLNTTFAIVLILQGVSFLRLFPQFILYMHSIHFRH